MCIYFVVYLYIQVFKILNKWVVFGQIFLNKQSEEGGDIVEGGDWEFGESLKKNKEQKIF